MAGLLLLTCCAPAPLEMRYSERAADQPVTYEVRGSVQWVRAQWSTTHSFVNEKSRAMFQVDPATPLRNTDADRILLWYDNAMLRGYREPLWEPVFRRSDQWLLVLTEDSRLVRLTPVDGWESILGKQEPIELDPSRMMIIRGPPPPDK